MARRPLSVCSHLLTFGLILASALTLAPSPSLAVDGTWTPFDPGSLMSHTFTLDPAGSRAILFGGWDGRIFDNSSVHNDTWSLDLSGAPTWHRMLPSSTLPTARMEHVMVLDPTRNRMIVFGGKSTNAYFNDLWALDLTGTGAWSPLAADGTPPAPMETRGIYDPLRDRVIFFGGYRPSSPINELWQLTLSGTPTWSMLAANNAPPPARVAHTMIYDPMGDRVIVFGGKGNVAYLNDVWQLSLGGTPTWTHLLPSGTPPDGRYGHNAIFDSQRLRMIVFGGFNDGTGFMFNDVWALDLMSLTWSQLSIDGTLPLGAMPYERDFSAMAYDAEHQRIALYGGNVGRPNANGTIIRAEPSGDLWILDIADIHTPVLVSNVESETSPDFVRLRWHVSELDRSFDVWRSESDGGWSLRGTVRAGSGGFLTYEDRDVRAGTTYSYRLQFEDEGATQFGGQVQVLVPLEYSLRLDAAPLISDGRFSVELTLPTPGAAHLAI